MIGIAKTGVFMVAAMISCAMIGAALASNCDLKTGAGCSVALAGGDPQADLVCSPLKVGTNITLVCMPRASTDDNALRQTNPDRAFWKPVTDAWWKD
jgi:hypothetical protein